MIFSAQFSAKSKLWKTVTKMVINQKRLELRMNAAPFQNLENQRNQLVFVPKLQVISFSHNLRSKFNDFLALNFRQHAKSKFWKTITKMFVNKKWLELRINAALFQSLENQGNILVCVPKLQAIQLSHNSRLKFVDFLRSIFSKI